MTRRWRAPVPEVEGAFAGPGVRERADPGVNRGAGCRHPQLYRRWDVRRIPHSRGMLPRASLRGRCRHGSGRRVRLVSVPTKRRAPNLQEIGRLGRFSRVSSSRHDSRSVRSEWERPSCPASDQAQTGP